MDGGRRTEVQIGFMIDGLTAMMMCVVTFVSLMVHLYSIGYMAEIEGLQALLQLSSRCSPSDADAGDEQQLLQLFFGWEAVAWCPTC